MLGTSTALTTASSSTSHMSAILRLFDSVRAGRCGGPGRRAGCRWNAGPRPSAGWAWSSAPRRAHEGHQRHVHEEDVLAAELVTDLSRGFDERLRLDVAHRAADLGDDHVGLGRLGRLQAHAALDLVGDVRDDLHGVAEVLPAALAGDDLRVDLAGRDVGRLAQLDVEEALVVADVEVGLGPVVGDEHLTVLERVHRARIHVQVGVELLHDDAQSTRREKVAEACRRQALTE